MRESRKSCSYWRTAFALFGIAWLLLSLGACSGNRQSAVIAVNQFAQHPLLDEVTRGLKDELAGAGITENGNPRLVIKNANGETSVAVQINQQFVNDHAAVIVALGTPSAQSAVQVTKTVPIVFGAITDPVKAGIAESIQHPGGNKTGTSDRWPFEQQVALIKQLVPSAKRVGIILNPAESNSEASMSYIRPALQREQLQIVEVPVANTSEVFGAARSLAGRCDVFFVPGDNTLISAFDSLLKVAQQNRIPVIGGTEDLVKMGSIATYAPDYYQIGRTTGRIVLEVYRNHKDPGSIPVTIADQGKVVLNSQAAQGAGVVIPASLAKAIQQ